MDDCRLADPDGTKETTVNTSITTPPDAALTTVNTDAVVHKHSASVLSGGEKLLFGVLWGFALTEQDFEKYSLYYLLVRCTGGCDIIGLYSSMLLIANLLLPLVSFIIGWISDSTARFQHRVLQSVTVLNVTLLSCQVACGLYGQYVGLVICYQIRQICMAQIMSSYWKLLKIRICSDDGSASSDAYNAVSSSCGNTGDITSMVCNTLSLGVLAVLGLDFEINLTAVCVWGFFCNAGTALLAFYFRDKHLAHVKQSPGELWKSPSWSSVVSTVKSLNSGLQQRGAYLWGSPAVRNTLVHTLLAWLLFLLLTYPVTVFGNSAFIDSSNQPTESNQCNGLLPRLLVQGAALNAVFIVTAVLYRIFLVDCPPLRYFGRIFPLLCAISLGFVLVLLASKNSILSMISITIAQVPSYYMVSFSFYLLNTAASEQYLGFVLSLCWFGQQGLYILMSSLMLVNTPLAYIVIGCAAIVLLMLAQDFATLRPAFQSPWGNTTQDTPYNGIPDIGECPQNSISKIVVSSGR
ncbi:hypothetical protein Pelo_8970 [Pelomyxa schiedti]|nr:hypothetical protein Pelo_8970 [Pelomyxa schiedti]